MEWLSKEVSRNSCYYRVMICRAACKARHVWYTRHIWTLFDVRVISTPLQQDREENARLKLAAGKAIGNVGADPQPKPDKRAKHP